MRISDWSSDVCSSDLLSCFRRLRGDCGIVVSSFGAKYLAGVTRSDDAEIAEPDARLDLVQRLMERNRVASSIEQGRDRRAKMGIGVTAEDGRELRNRLCQGKRRERKSDV